MLTKRQILVILGLISEKFGGGYSSNKEILALQAKLSIMLEMAKEEE